MHDIIRKAAGIFEEHVEKMVLGIVGLVCLWLLVTRVLFSPNVVEYDNKKFSPAAIDPYINNQAAELKTQLSQKPEPKEPYKSRLNNLISPDDPVRKGIWGNLQKGFVGLFDSTIKGIDTNVYLPLPVHSTAEMGAKRKYTLPVIGKVSSVTVEHVRAVAYVPTEEINEQNAYETAEHEPNDVDLVTVEAKFDAAGLYDKFHRKFVSEVENEEWIDPCLAEPVFAAVQLQRQEMLNDGSWSFWQDLPRSKVEHYRDMFEIIEEVDELPLGGIKVRLLQFDTHDVRTNLLQPKAYQIASAEEEWFPPSLHKGFLEQLKKEKMEEKREAREAEREQEQESDDRRNRRTDTRVGTGGRAGGRLEGLGGAMGLFGGGTRTRRSPTDRRTDRGRLTDGRGAIESRSTRRRGRDDRETERERLLRNTEAEREPSIGDFYDELDKISIARKADLSKLREPLVFWAHDDTVEPEKSYRYRIRLGVFNPIAGTNQLSEQDSWLKDKVILWSEFSDITEPVDIPAKIYMFARDIQEAAKTVTVQVCKYMLGYWYSEDFAVRQGEVIGKVVESESAEPEPIGRRRLAPTKATDEVIEPDRIDYNTGAVLVDSVRVNDWTGEKSLRQRIYYDMLYSYDGTNIEHMPVESRNWPTELLAKFNQIKREQREPKEPLRDWNSRLAGSGTQRAMGRDIYEGVGLYREADGFMR